MNRPSIHNALQLLIDEHNEFKVFLDIFENFAHVVNDESKNNNFSHLRELKKFTCFLKYFSDIKHLEKEENILFVAMEKHGFSIDSGPIHVMIYEHNIFRKHAQTLDEFASKSDTLNAEYAQVIADTILEYCKLLRNHIDKEDNILFPTITLHVPSEVLNDVFEQFCNVDKELENKYNFQQIKSSILEFSKSIPSIYKDSHKEITMTNPQFKPEYDYFYCDECKTHIPCQRVSPGNWVVECPYCDGECFSCQNCTLTEGCFGKGGDMNMVIKKT